MRNIILSLALLLLCSGTAMAQNTNAAQAASDRGWTAIKAGNYDTALKEFSEVIRLVPNISEGYAGRGTAYYGKGDYDRAITDYTEAIRLADPRREREKVEVVYVKRADSYLRISCFDKAIADFETATRLGYTNSEKRIELAKFEERIELAKFVVENSNDWKKECAAHTSASPSSQSTSGSSGTFTDSRDGKTYKAVTIGSQTWMAENLNYNASGSKCYNNKSANCDKYGRLYDWNTAKTACPSGWHLPSKAEFEALRDFVGGEETAGKFLKAKSGWKNNYYGKSGNGTDAYGFSALPGGYGSSGGSFNDVGNLGYWWSASENSNHDANAYVEYAAYDREEAFWSNAASFHKNSHFLSVRCAQNN